MIVYLHVSLSNITKRKCTKVENWGIGRNQFIRQFTEV